MVYSIGDFIQTGMIIFAIGGSSAYLKNEIKHLTQEMKRLNGSIKDNRNSIHELDCWKSDHVEKFHAKR